jgi:hypothetical protein
MGHDRVRASFGARYGDFLYTALGEDADSGLSVSVLSALARLDVDPWELAEALARMPFDTAVDRFAAILKTLPCVACGREHPLALARRLIALLPDGSAAPSGAATAAGGEVLLDRVFSRHAAATLERVRRRPTVHYLFFYFMFVVFLVCSQWLSPSAEQTPADEAVPSVGTPEAAPAVATAHDAATERSR